MIMKTVQRSLLAAALAAAFCGAPLYAQAALFEDAEARRAILDIRKRIDDLNTRLEGKAERTTNLDLAAQNEQLRQEIARLNGQIEVLTNELANTQRRQRDFYTDLDGRLRKMEPQPVNIDGKEVSIAPEEQRTYEAALAMFKAGDYKNAGAAFSAFVRRYPQSGFAPAAYYWLGNTYYAQRDYRNAIVAQQTVVNSFPDNAKAPDALLNIASCYAELKDRTAARKALDTLIASYPNSPAAQTAKERLATLK